MTELDKKLAIIAGTLAAIDIIAIAILLVGA